MITTSQVVRFHYSLGMHDLSIGVQVVLDISKRGARDARDAAVPEAIAVLESGSYTRCVVHTHYGKARMRSSNAMA